MSTLEDLIGGAKKRKSKWDDEPAAPSASTAPSAPAWAIPAFSSIPLFRANSGPQGRGAPSSRKKRKGGSSAGDLEVSVRRATIKGLLEHEGIIDNFQRNRVLQLFGELLELKDLEMLGDLTLSCATTGAAALGALREVFLCFRRHAATVEKLISDTLYKTVVDHICLSTDREFSLSALDILMQYRFAPNVMEFVSGDAQEYYAREQHFINLELLEEVSSLQKKGDWGVHSVSCDISPGTSASDRFSGTTGTDPNLWEVRPRGRWSLSRDQFREESGRSLAPVRGDLLALQMGGERVIAVVTEGARGPDSATQPVTVVVEQTGRLQRLLRGNPSMIAMVGASKVAYDRMRLAVLELAKKTTPVPSMQQWLILRRPTPANQVEQERGIPKDGTARLWRVQSSADGREVPTSIEAVGAEWVKLQLPGMRRGPLFFSQENQFADKEFDPESCSGCVVVVCRGGESGFAEKARNVAAGGAIGMVVADGGEAKSLFPMSCDHEPFRVDLAKGQVAGMTIEMGMDGYARVADLVETSPLAQQVSYGDLVEEVTTPQGSLTYEQCEQLLGGSKPLDMPVQIIFRWDRAPPSIPGVMVRKTDGERLINALQEAAKLGSPPPNMELHVAEVARSVTQLPVQTDVPLDHSQREAVQKAYTKPVAGKRGGSVSVIQGPPGTGKTTTALQIIRLWLSDTNAGKILVTGYSNIAIDNIALGLQKMGVEGIMRVGRGQTVLTSDTLDEKIKDHRLYGELLQTREMRGPGSRAEAIKIEKKIVQDLVTTAKVVLATCITAGGDVLTGARFKRVLFDEATQATEPSSLVPLARGCEELVLLGDQRQLPPTIMSNEARQLGLHESLFERLVRLGLPHTMLRVQYRMHPALSAFPSHTFYSGLISNGTKAEDRLAPLGFKWPNPLLPLCFYGVGMPHECIEEHVGTSRRNRREAELVQQIITGLLAARDVPPKEIAVISPYAAQTDLLKNLLGRHRGVSINTVDSFQGMERDVIICSAVRSSAGGVGFLSDVRRFNVLLTRARRGLIVVGHQQTLSSDPCWRHWVLHTANQKVMCGQVVPPQLAAEEPILPDSYDKEKAGGPGRWMAFADSWPKQPPPQQVGASSSLGSANPLKAGLLRPTTVPAAFQTPSVALDSPAVTQALSTAHELLLKCPHTGFSEVGTVVMDVRDDGGVFTSAIPLVLPNAGTQAAQGTGLTRKQAELRCCVNACEILSAAGLMEAKAVTVLVAASLAALGKGAAPSAAQPSVVQAGPALPGIIRPTGTIIPGVQLGMVRPPLLAGGGGGRPDIHPKQKLMQLMQRRGHSGPLPIQFVQVGKPPTAMFTATYSFEPLQGVMLIATGTARTKKEAEKLCCEDALQQYEQRGLKR